MAERGPLGANDRVSVEQEFHELYNKLVERASKNPESQPFTLLKHAFMWSVALGVRSGRRLPLSSPKSALIFWHTLSENQDVPVLEAIAIAETGDVEVLLQGSQVLLIAEEYANAGIREIKRELVDKPGLPLWNLVDVARRGTITA